MIEIKTTMDSSLFDKFGVPECGSVRTIDDTKFPYIKDLVNKSLFAVLNDKIVEVQIVAWAYSAKDFGVPFNRYLLKMPNNTLMWTANQTYYPTLKDLLNEKNKIEIPTRQLEWSRYDDFFNGQLWNSWIISNEVKSVRSQILRIFGTENEAIILYEHPKKSNTYYNSREEALAAKFGNMKIELREKPTTIKFDYEYAPSVPFKMVLKVE